MSKYHIYAIIFLILVVSFSLVAPSAKAVDEPHLTATANNCTLVCHGFHGAAGPQLTAFASNSALCISCHNPTGDASAKPFSDAMEANPGVGGNSHPWTKSMPGSSSATNTAGLRATADITDPQMKARLNQFSDVVSCSVCHDQHKQTRDPYDPLAPASAGSAGRHFMRSVNDMNQMCEDCHWYRSEASGQTDPKTHQGGNPISHPVNVDLSSVSNPDQFLSTPKEDCGSDQGGTRFQNDGACESGSSNKTNNLTVDTSTPNGKFRCLSCHNVHYSDSDKDTCDVPGNPASGDAACP
jgi:predicted CXXCH cytochrome family protein